MSLKFRAIVLLTAFLVFGILISASDIVKEEREVADFNRIEMGGSGKIYLTQGDHESLVIETEAEILPYIRSEVRGGTLHLDIKRGWRWIKPVSIPPIKYYVTMKEINGIGLSGAGELSAPEISTDDLEIEISGSGEAKISKLTAESLDLKISGSGELDITGKCNRIKFKISGSGDIEASDLEASTGTIRISGSGDADVWVKDVLSVTIVGSGEVRYYGNPSISTSVSGSGKTKSLGEK